MIVRDPLIFATYYYLYQSPDDTAARRADRRGEFDAEVRRMSQALAGWLALPMPNLPELDPGTGDQPHDPHPLMEAQTLHGRTNASVVLRAYTLRNMLLLRVIVARGGEHEQSAWEMLDDALGPVPTAESWLHTSRYWCGVAPRLPESMGQERAHPVQAAFGVLCLGHGPQAHVLVYPDARTEQRANTFLTMLAPRLDWYPVQARHRMATYANYVSTVAYRQQRALDRIMQATHMRAAAAQPGIHYGANPLHTELDSLETLHNDVIGDLAMTHSAVGELRSLAVDYRLELMQSGLWSAAPTAWQAEVAMLSTMEEQIAADVHYVETTLRRVEFLLNTMQTRLAVQQADRMRIFAYAMVGLIAAMLLVMIAGSDLGQLGLRLGILVLIAAVGGAGWWYWQRRQSGRDSS